VKGNDNLYNIETKPDMERESNIKIYVLERNKKNSREVQSTIRANNIILNITSKFEGNSSVDELLFRMSEQKIMKTLCEETVVGTFDTPFDQMI
jgi:hypothetical protein